MNNTELLAYIYWGGWVVTFLVGMFTTETTEGRMCTGRPDVFLSILLAVAWPLLLPVMVALWLFLEWRGRK